ncbi:MAG TPA: thioredoxin [Gammaproteobacteria bacterium]|nr:thioredoxin [Gammaproteobacteria bacterium]
MVYFSRQLFLFFSLLIVWLPAVAIGIDITAPDFDDRPLAEPVETPDWFFLSFLDIKEDLGEIKKAGKKGLIVYFGQKRCPYCKAFLENNFNKRDVVYYTRKNFEIIAIDVRGTRLVTQIDGTVIPENEFAEHLSANFTPSLLFYDLAGNIILKLVGYQSPYRFRAALEFVADAHYQKESFRKYLARGAGAPNEGKATLNTAPFLSPPPYALDRSRYPAQRPLLVLFEQKNCHSCDVLHAGPFSRRETRNQLRAFDVVQLDMWSEAPVITPTGKRTTAREWAERLQLNYAPTLIFYSERGKEIIRVDSVIYFYRLRGVLDYILTRGYEHFRGFQEWRRRLNR